MNKSLLLVIHPFAPLSGPRSLRWLHLTRVLSRLGWSINVLTINPSKNDALYDASLCEAVEDNVTVRRSYPGFFYRLSHRNKKNGGGFLKTTAEWLPFGLLEGMRIVRRRKPSLMVSSALPFVGHMIAYGLKKTTGIPWAADYGDPIGFNPMTSPLKRRAGTWMEGRMLKAADALIVNCEEMRKEFLKFYPFLRHVPSTVIEHGVDESFKDIPPEPFPGKFVLVHTGSFYIGHREPDNLFRALSILARDRTFAEEALLILAGDSKKKYARLARSMNIGDMVRFAGRLSFFRSVSFLKGASVLLYIGGKESYFHYQSKIFEYAAAGRPVLAVKQSGTDLGPRFVAEKRLGEVVPNEVSALCETIKYLYRLWKNSGLEEQYPQRENISYEWKDRGKDLERFLVERLLLEKP